MKFYKNWSLGYSAARDIDLKIMRNQRFSLKFNDDCTLIEVFYLKTILIPKLSTMLPEIHQVLGYVFHYLPLEV